MNEHWKSIYFYHGPSLYSEKIAIFTAIIPVAIFFASSAYLFIIARRKSEKSKYKSELLFSIVFFVYFCFDLITEIDYVAKRNQLNAAAATGDCKTFEGKLTNINPETGDGHMAFEIAGRLFRYDNHHFALNEQLCDGDGPSICVGDIARLCLHSESDGEILKIEKHI